jgi:hypothetical protein
MGGTWLELIITTTRDLANKLPRFSISSVRFSTYRFYSAGVLVHRFSVSATKLATARKRECYARSMSCTLAEFSRAFIAVSSARDALG